MTARIPRRTFLGLGLALAAAPISLLAEDTLPEELNDEQFWKLISSFSEKGGSFPYENFLSNEISFQTVIPNLKTITKPGGAYLGVGPEQNFTYIAAMEPKIAFVIDIRRQNMLELLMYKALFELSPDRADFISRLFSRKRPAGLDNGPTVDVLFRAFQTVPTDPELFAQNRQAIQDNLARRHKLPLTNEDQQAIDHVFQVFYDGGPAINYAFQSPGAPTKGASYVSLMTAYDLRGQSRSYLATERNFELVREMQRKNLIVPLVGDFAGPTTIRAVGQYLKDHSATVSAFYTSNVEEYIQERPQWTQFCSSVASLPADFSSVFIRWSKSIPSGTVLNPMAEFIDAVRRGNAPSIFEAVQMGR